MPEPLGAATAGPRLFPGQPGQTGISRCRDRRSFPRQGPTNVMGSKAYRRDCSTQVSNPNGEAPQPQRFFPEIPPTRIHDAQASLGTALLGQQTIANVPPCRRTERQPIRQIDPQRPSININSQATAVQLNPPKRKTETSKPWTSSRLVTPPQATTTATAALCIQEIRAQGYPNPAAVNSLNPSVPNAGGPRPRPHGRITYWSFPSIVCCALRRYDMREMNR